MNCSHEQFDWGHSQKHGTCSCAVGEEREREKEHGEVDLSSGLVNLGLALRYTPSSELRNRPAVQTEPPSTHQMASYSVCYYYEAYCRRLWEHKQHCGLRHCVLGGREWLFRKEGCERWICTS